MLQKRAHLSIPVIMVSTHVLEIWSKKKGGREHEQLFAFCEFQFKISMWQLLVYMNQV